MHVKNTRLLRVSEKLPHIPGAPSISLPVDSSQICVWDGSKKRDSACQCDLWRFGIEWIIEMVLRVFKPQIHQVHVLKIGKFIALEGEECSGVGF